MEGEIKETKGVEETKEKKEGKSSDGGRKEKARGEEEVERWLVKGQV